MTLEHSYANTHIKMPTPLFKNIIDQIIKWPLPSSTKQSLFQRFEFNGKAVCLNWNVPHKSISCLLNWTYRYLTLTYTRVAGSKSWHILMSHVTYFELSFVSYLICNLLTIQPPSVTTYSTDQIHHNRK